MKLKQGVMFFMLGLLVSVVTAQDDALNQFLNDSAQGAYVFTHAVTSGSLERDLDGTHRLTLQGVPETLQFIQAIPPDVLDYDPALFAEDWSESTKLVGEGVEVYALAELEVADNVMVFALKQASYDVADAEMVYEGEIVMYLPAGTEFSLDMSTIDFLILPVTFEDAIFTFSATQAFWDDLAAAATFWRATARDARPEACRRVEALLNNRQNQTIIEYYMARAYFNRHCRIPSDN